MHSPAQKHIVINGTDLSIQEVVNVSRLGIKVELTQEETILKRIRTAEQFVLKAVQKNETIYGVTTAFGGMANLSVPAEMTTELQNNLPWPHKTGAGHPLPEKDIRAAMLLRSNALMKGASGVRLELIQRFVDCLNLGLTPMVYDLGSIGASGDLVPLSHILGSIVGLSPEFMMNLDQETLDSVQALQKAGLSTMSLAPKEGLAVINGTSVMSGMACHCLADAKDLLILSLGANALILQGLSASNQSFHPYVHRQKPHPGQKWAAEELLRLLHTSRLIKDELSGQRVSRENEPVQDRYSLRCLPQFIGPIVDGLRTICHQVEVELNSATDNPLIDPDRQVCYYCGNFLGQYIGMAMDQLRSYLGLMAKHLDVQIALLVAPEFNNHLAPSLVGNQDNSVNLGLKGLQLTANSIAPLVSFYGNSLVDRFPTHAEQFNQNINSQGFGSANLTRQSIEMMQQLTAIALIFGVQAVDLRTKLLFGDYKVSNSLSPQTLNLYKGILKVLGLDPEKNRPYIFNDHEQSLDRHIALIVQDIRARGHILEALTPGLNRLHEFIYAC